VWKGTPYFCQPTRVCTSKKGLDQARFSTDAFDSIPEFDTQMLEIEATDIAQFDPLEVSPEPLTGIQLGRIGRQPFQVNAVCRPVPQKRLDHLTAVDGGPIPDDHHAPGHLPQQMLQKGDHVL
jgi:hypothetical protein